jgi:hypothetical protein
VIEDNSMVVYREDDQDGKGGGLRLVAVFYNLC